MVSRPENDTDGVDVTAKRPLEKTNAPKDLSAVGNKIFEEPPAATQISKGEKASKKTDQGRKQGLKARIGDSAKSTVSAYPTQRPPRKKPAKKPKNTRNTSQKKGLDPEVCSSETMPATQRPTRDGHESNDHEENESEPQNHYESDDYKDNEPHSCTFTKEPSRRDSEFLAEEQEGVKALEAEEVHGNHHKEKDQEPSSLPKELSQEDWELSVEEQEGFKSCAAEEIHNDHDEKDQELLSLPEESPQEWNSASEIQEVSKTGVIAEACNRERSESDITVSPCRINHHEDTITHADKPTTSSPSIKPIQTYNSGAQGLLWAYRVRRKVDRRLIKAGIRLWRKPTTYFHFQPWLQTDLSGCLVPAPVVISRERRANTEPIIEFDGRTVHIVPHEQYWEDVRSHISHPDFLILWKLVEYQACEAAGYRIWRHDRDHLGCRKPGCNAIVSDYHRSTVICYGCGPKSVVRYCSLQHQLEDIGGHWRVCGTWNVLLRSVIDHSTAPSKFARMFPAIKQRHGSATEALYRQKLYCAVTYGHYTLFDPDLTRCKTLCWSKQDPRWPEMDRRVERLLNVAFLDSWNHSILGYLYRLLRELLRSQGEWFESTERLLKQQFESEFSDYKVNTNWREAEAPCQCEWTGNIVPQWNHSSTCWAYAPGADDDGIVSHIKRNEGIVEDYEERFWILRAWRQQHPTQNNWRLRAAGYGFPNVVLDEECYKLGPWWTGWGGAMDNRREEQSDRREQRSLWSA